MSNCTKILFNSSNTIINICLDKCDHLIGTQCICDCLDNPNKYNKKTDYNSTIILLTLACVSIGLFIMCICYSFKKDRNRRNVVNNISIDNPNNNQNEIALEINYYDLPKYEDIVNIPNEITVNDITSEAANEAMQNDPPPNYDDVII